jgi:hypothetical protein
MKNNSPAVAAFDRDGMVFGVALASKTLKLFDIRHLDKVIVIMEFIQWSNN